MSTVELPVATKRSARFKRYSWNQAANGSFPPINRHKRSRAAVRHIDDHSTQSSPLVYEPLHVSFTETDTILPLSPSPLPDDNGQQHRGNPPAPVASGDVPEPVLVPVPEPTLPTQKPSKSIKGPPPLQKKSGKNHGKKRKGVYLGPSWDDEAGSLPTSATVNDMDFDSLLSQVVNGS